MMNKIILFMIGAMMIYSCGPISKTPNSKDPISKNDSEGMKDYYEISVNEEFQIPLSANPTTGYSWVWVNNQAIDIVDSISQAYVSNPNPSQLSGVGGKEIWKFKGVKSGVDSIIMKYCQSWNRDATVDLTIIKIKVR